VMRCFTIARALSRLVMGMRRQGMSVVSKRKPQYLTTRQEGVNFLGWHSIPMLTVVSKK
jgi:hypothetical protein